jgi:hypothetical protein
MGLGGGRVVRAVVGGLLGAALGTALYEVAGSLLFALGGTGEPLAATAPARVLAHATVGVIIALGAAVFAESKGHSAA